jgi:hypothetical protein
VKYEIEDKALVKKILALVDKLERLNDSVGCTPIRHAISHRVVEIRLLARDGHLRNMNGGRP